MAKGARTGLGNTDAAALGAATLAAAWPMFQDPGPWDTNAMGVSITSFLLVIGYVWGHQKSWLKVMAVAAVLALVVSPFIGFMIEYVASGFAQTLIDCGSLNSCDAPGGNRGNSVVDRKHIMMLWAAIFAARVNRLFGADPSTHSWVD